MAYHFAIKDQQQRQFVEQITEKAEEYFMNAGIISPVNKGIDIKVTVSPRLTRALGKTVLQYNRENGSYKDCEIRLSKEIIDMGSIGVGSQTMAHELIHVLYPTQGHGPIFKATCKRLNQYNRGIDISVRWSGQGATPDEKERLARIRDSKQKKRMERKIKQIKKLSEGFNPDLMSPEMMKAVNEVIDKYNLDEIRP